MIYHFQKGYGIKKGSLLSMAQEKATENQTTIFPRKTQNFTDNKKSLENHDPSLFEG